MKAHLYFARQLNILKDLGLTLNKDVKILDLGCGNGDLVYEYRKNGYESYGCDMKFKEGEHKEFLSKKNIIKLIPNKKYQIPFDNNFFDVVFSHQVFEHVLNYDETLKEISRVLKSDGVSIHKFPSRWAIFESHIYVPFGCRFKNYGWILFWTYLGFRKKSQRKLNAKTVTKENYNYLLHYTYYPTRKQIKKYAKPYFNYCHYKEHLYFKYTRPIKLLYYLSFILPFIPFLINIFFIRLLILRKN